MYYVNYFFLYSILGHLLETFIYLFYSGESGILFCPWTPIYGFGVVIIIYGYNLIKKRVQNKWLQYFLVFLIGFILLTILEWVGGILIEKIFGIVFWSYKDFKFNYGNYISLEVSLIWGLASMMVVKLLSFTDKWIKKIPRSISWLFIILMSLDVIATLLFK